MKDALRVTVVLVLHAAMVLKQEKIFRDVHDSAVLSLERNLNFEEDSKSRNPDHAFGISRQFCQIVESMKMFLDRTTKREVNDLPHGTEEV